MLLLFFGVISELLGKLYGPLFSSNFRKELTNVYNEEGLRIQYDRQYTSQRDGRKSTYSYTSNNFEFDQKYQYS